MADFFHTRELEGARLEFVSLRGARIREADLAGVTMRGVYAAGLEIDTPGLLEGPITVNGVDVVPLVDAELNRRFPGRELRRASSPEELREAWAAVERAWVAARERVEAMPAEVVDAAVDGEWSFAQTERHLILATDVWLRGAILGVEQPFHEFGLAFDGATEDDLDLTLFVTDPPSYSEVLRVRAERMAMVRDFVATVTPQLLGEERRNPWDRSESTTVGSCLRVILNEEWEHLRYALRDLDAVASATGPESISG